jgi:hypothetical protein
MGAGCARRPNRRREAPDHASAHLLNFSNASSYPEPFREGQRKRYNRRLGDHAGLAGELLRKRRTPPVEHKKETGGKAAGSRGPQRGPPSRRDPRP